MKTTYTCEACILDHLRASGPATLRELRLYCVAQAVPYSSTIFVDAMEKLKDNGVIECDDSDVDEWFWQLVDTGYRF